MEKWRMCPSTSSIVNHMKHFVAHSNKEVNWVWTVANNFVLGQIDCNKLKLKRFKMFKYFSSSERQRKHRILVSFNFFTNQHATPKGTKRFVNWFMKYISRMQIKTIKTALKMNKLNYYLSFCSPSRRWAKNYVWEMWGEPPIGEASIKASALWCAKFSSLITNFIFKPV